MNFSLQIMRWSLMFFASMAFAADPCLEAPVIEDLKDVLGLNGVALNTPKSVDKVLIASIPINVDQIAKMEKGKRFGFVLGEDDKIRFLEEPLDLNKKKLWVAKELDDPTKGDFLIKAHGSFAYDEASKTYVFKTTANVDLSAEEMKALKVKAEKMLGAKANVKDLDAIAPAQMLKCKNIIEAGKKGKNFILNSYIAENSVFFTTLFGSKLVGGDLIGTPEARQAAIADFVAMNIGIGVGGTITKRTILNNYSPGKMLLISGTQQYAVVLLNNQLYKFFVKDAEHPEGRLEEMQLEDGEELSSQEQYSKDLRAYNNAWFFLKQVPINTYTNNLIGKKLPEYLFNRCMAGKAISVFISPRMVRFYERYASSIGYYGLRNAVVKKKDEEVKHEDREQKQAIEQAYEKFQSKLNEQNAASSLIRKPVTKKSSGVNSDSVPSPILR